MEEPFQPFVNTHVLFPDLWKLKPASEREHDACVVSEDECAREGGERIQEKRINREQPPVLWRILTKALIEWLHRGMTSWQCSQIMGTQKCQLIYDVKLRPPLGWIQPLWTSCLLGAHFFGSLIWRETSFCVQRSQGKQHTADCAQCSQWRPLEPPSKKELLRQPWGAHQGLQALVWACRENQHPTASPAFGKQVTTFASSGFVGAAGLQAVRAIQSWARLFSGAAGGCPAAWTIASARHSYAEQHYPTSALIKNIDSWKRKSKVWTGNNNS